MQKITKLPLSVTILTKNSQKYLSKVLKSVEAFDEVLIYDTGSTDNTLEIASQFPQVKVLKGPFIGFGPTHNQASQLAKNDWIVSLDSDEILSSDLLDELQHLKLEENTIYSFSRRNFYRGKWIRWCGWHPDRVLRIYNRKQTQFTNAQVHESIMSKGFNQVKLKYPALHYPYETTQDFLNKMQSYSTLFAEQNKGIKNSSFSKALGHGLFTFFKSYFLKRGFMGGREGFIISYYNANTAFYKYLKLWEANQRKEEACEL